MRFQLGIARVLFDNDCLSDLSRRHQQNVILYIRMVFSFTKSLLDFQTFISVTTPELLTFIHKYKYKNYIKNMGCYYNT